MSGWRKKQIANLQAGADIHAGDSGYEIGNAEDHAAFVAERNKSMMNKRIQELIVEATVKANNPLVDSCGQVVCDDWEETIDLEKFAESIVKETMQVVANQLPGNQYLDVADAVIKHFGVE